MELGAKLKRYYGDNGDFKAKAYTYDLEKMYQEMSYSGVEAYG